MTSFDTLGLSAQLLSSIEGAGFTEATGVQARAIPLLLEGRDLMGTAQTGEGKTAAYLLPMLHRLSEQNEAPVPGKPRVLILAPTRELAGQIGEALRQFSKGLRVYYTVIYGGTPFMVQRKVLERGVHIVVATPGRLMDHVRRSTLKLDKVNSFVLDEADRMLDMGFVDEVKDIAAAIPAEHQTVMFSATMNRGVRGLAAQLLNTPGLIEIGRENSVATTIDHRVMRIKYPDKKPLLLHLLARPEISRVLVFTRTKAMADELVQIVKAAGLKADAIHGDLEQSVRQKVLRKFRAAEINILIATDVAARGIDVPDITHVINFDMPVEAEAYVHRVGRTGRAGAKGVALSICVANEGGLLHQIERLIGLKVPVDSDHPFHDNRAASRRDPRPAEGARPNRPFQKSAPRKGPPPHRRDDNRDSGSFHRGEAVAAPRPARTDAPRPARADTPRAPHRETAHRADRMAKVAVSYKSKAPHQPRGEDSPRPENGRRDDRRPKDGNQPRKKHFGGKPSRRPAKEAGFDPRRRRPVDAA
jgi:ATP-dependent RNA helicase RhlE